MAPIVNGNLANGHVVNSQDQVTIQDLEDPINTISGRVQNHHVSNGVNHMANGVANGHGPPKISNGLMSKYASLDAERQENIRNIYHRNELQMESHM